eukprot:TRINITY_DN2748_c0_g1_i1.p1 TRINITY_DN2748_c0_g1~~TRINITY_DN2748_c0_g1_i1.p1  ORF type:complete len:109 (-),score=13.93 TRINITY_DN2748_c0_g1_i1:482-808(-)
MGEEIKRPPLLPYHTAYNCPICNHLTSPHDKKPKELPLSNEWSTKHPDNKHKNSPLPVTASRVWGHFPTPATTSTTPIPDTLRRNSKSGEQDTTHNTLYTQQQDLQPL